MLLSSGPERSHIRQLFLVIIAAGLLQGCGFALRGPANLPVSLQQISVTGTDRAMVQRLKEALATNGARVVEAGKPDTARIDLCQSEYSRTVHTTNTDGRATSYAFHYRVGFAVYDASGDRLQDCQHLGLKQVLDYNPIQQLSSEQDEMLMQREMRNELVHLILHRLHRLQPK